LSNLIHPNLTYCPFFQLSVALEELSEAERMRRRKSDERLLRQLNEVRQGLRADIEEAVVVDEQIVGHTDDAVEADIRLVVHKDEAEVVIGDLMTVGQHMRDMGLSFQQALVRAEKYMVKLDGAAQQQVKESDLIHLKPSKST
jgi:hypothetical protein